MVRNHTGDVALEWIFVTAIGVLILCTIVFNLMSRAGSGSGNANSFITNLRDRNSALYNFSTTATSVP